MLRTTVYLIYKKQKTKRKGNKMHTHTQKKAEQKTQNKTKQKIPRNPNKQTRTIRLFNCIMLLSFHVHLWFMQFPWNTGTLMQFAWKMRKSTWEPKLLSTVVPLFLKKGKSAMSPET